MARALGERLSSPSGSGWSPAAKRYLVNFRLKISSLVATILTRSFSGNETSNWGTWSPRTYLTYQCMWCHPKYLKKYKKNWGSMVHDLLPIILLGSTCSPVPAPVCTVTFSGVLTDFTHALSYCCVLSGRLYRVCILQGVDRRPRSRSDRKQPPRTRCSTVGWWQMPGPNARRGPISPWARSWF